MTKQTPPPRPVKWNEGLTSNERAVFQCLLDRGFRPDMAREEALDGERVRGS